MADARLVAAAPSLLEALTECWQWAMHMADCERVPSDNPEAIFDESTGCTCYVGRAEAALRQARGEVVPGA